MRFTTEFVSQRSGLCWRLSDRWLYHRVCSQAQQLGSLPSESLTPQTATDSVALAGISKHGTTYVLISDLVAGQVVSNLACPLGANQIAVVRKAAGLSNVIYSRVTKGSAWSHHNTGTTIANQAAANEMLVASWKSTDILDGWLALIGIWDKELTQAGVEALDNNWATSDWQNHAEGQPVCLIQGNVPGSALVDLAGQATNRTHNGTTMDFEPVGTWVFDGTAYTPGAPMEFQEFRPDAPDLVTNWMDTRAALVES